MSEFEDWYVHEVIVHVPGEKNDWGEGTSSQVTVRCQLTKGEKLVIDGDGKEVVSSAQLDAPEDARDVLKNGRWVTLPGDARRRLIVSLSGAEGVDVDLDGVTVALV